MFGRKKTIGNKAGNGDCFQEDKMSRALCTVEIGHEATHDTWDETRNTTHLMRSL